MSSGLLQNPPSSSSPSVAREAIFVLGNGRGSGANLLAEFLDLHPDCRGMENLAEDFLLANVSHLEQFVEAVAQSWGPEADAGGRMKGELIRHLVSGWISFLAGRSAFGSRYVVTKTPAVTNLEWITNLPEAKILVAVRDGRDVVAAKVRQGREPLEQVAFKFAEGVRTILAAKERKLPFLLVRYEDLCREPRAEMTRILEYLGVDAATYDFGKADELAIDRNREAPAFAPWYRWTRSQRWQFNATAGKENDLLGYALSHAPGWRQLASQSCAAVHAFFLRFVPG